MTVITAPPGLSVVLTYDGSLVAPTNIGSYVVVGTVAELNYQCSATNTLVIHDEAPSITQQPTSITALAGSDASFSVTATGTAPLGYPDFADSTSGKLFSAGNSSNCGESSR